MLTRAGANGFLETVRAFDSECYAASECDSLECSVCQEFTFYISRPSRATNYPTGIPLSRNCGVTYCPSHRNFDSKGSHEPAFSSSCCTSFTDRLLAVDVVMQWPGHKAFGCCAVRAHQRLFCYLAPMNK
jgi:hypothetical protein